MANYIVSDTDLTSVANAIRTKGGTSAQLSFPDGFNTAIANIPTGGGLPGLAGSFTAQASTGVQTINIPYTGNGYPVSVQITIDGGAWGKSSFTKGEIQFASLVKGKPAVTPTYSGIAANEAGFLAIYAKDIYGSKGYIYSDTSFYDHDNPTTSHPLHVSANKQIKVYVSAASGTNGFLANQKYNYSIVYSE